MARSRPKNADDTAAHLKPCKGICGGRQTRPSWMLKREAPETSVRASADLCVTCYNTLNPPVERGPKQSEPTPEQSAEQEQRYDHNVTALQKYIDRRNQRLNRRILDGYRGTWDGVRHLRDGGGRGRGGVRADTGGTRREA